MQDSPASRGMDGHSRLMADAVVPSHLSGAYRSFLNTIVVLFSEIARPILFTFYLFETGGHSHWMLQVSMGNGRFKFVRMKGSSQ